MSNEKRNLILTSALAITEEQLSAIRALGYTVSQLPDDRPAPKELAAEAEVVVCYKFFKFNSLSDFPKLRYVHSVATGVELLPLKELAQAGLAVGKGRDLYSIPMAEWTVCRLLEHYKLSRHYAENARRHYWERAAWIDYKSEIEELAGRKVAIYGTGDIAAVLCRLLRAFEVESIAGMNSTGHTVEGYDVCYAPHQLAEFLEDRDVVVTLAPLTAENQEIFDEKAIAGMKDGAVFVSLSRGRLVKTKAVVEALKAGKLAAFLADVVAEEPLGPESELWDMENVYLTPHNSFITEMRPVRLNQLIYDNLQHYLATGKPRDAVDLTKGY